MPARNAVLSWVLVLAACFAPAVFAAPTSGAITLVKNGADGEEWGLTFGVPFPPGVLTDARQVRILDERGDELPASVIPTLRWHFKDGSIRAVRVQLRVAAFASERRLRFETDQPRTRDLEGWPYVNDLVRNGDGVKVPGVLAVHEPTWTSASRIAGPQHPATVPSAYDRYFAIQFDEWAGKLPKDDHSAWLFDRPTTLFKQYVRTGNRDYLREAISSYRFYMAHIQHGGSTEYPNCAGGWKYGNSSPCDPKYIYVEPIVLALALTGDDSLHTPALVRQMIEQWDTKSWRGNRGPYTSPELPYTERLAGLGLIQTVNAYELTGDSQYLDRIKTRLDWLHEHQTRNPDGLGDDGSWRHSWHAHEGSDYDAETDIRGASPWMSENIIDGLWQAWLVEPDPRIPGMIAGFGRYMEQHGWIPDAVLARRDWTTGCAVERGGPIAWYWSSSQATLEQLMEAQESEGWYSDDHNVQLMLTTAAARYFETDSGERARHTARLKKVSVSYREGCARRSVTVRRFNWNNRGAGVVQWFLQPGNEYRASGAVD